ncbi:hypothetical protein DFH28DRAFT_1190943 [Melampsora americana]|nr:hypothetical protein DFH28DRAFT_1190943 [Melampsora americana]
MVKRTLDSAVGTSQDAVEVIVIKDDNEVIVIDSNSETSPSNKPNDITTKNTTGKTPQTDVITSCPVSVPGTPCALCKTTRTVSYKILSCHCGSQVKLQKGRVEAAIEHWNSRTSKKNAVKKPCAGLNDANWKRPHATTTISNCIQHSPTSYHGAKRWKVCLRLFNTTHEVTLSEEQRNQLHATLESEATWVIKRHGAQGGIYLVDCAQTVLTDSKVEIPICENCEAIKKLRSVIVAVNTPYATKETIKYIPKILMSGDQFQAILIKFSELQILQTSLEKSTKEGDEAFWKAIGMYGKAGLFKNQETMRGLMMAVGVRAERESKGKSMRGRRFDVYFDNFLTTLAAISPRALCFFNDNFAGRGARSMRQIRLVKGMHLKDGLHPGNFERLAELLDELEYTGPVAAATDETVCVKAIRHYNGHLVGAQGGDISFSDGDDIERLVTSVVTKNELCSKIRAYTIQIPLPNMSTYVVAIIASRSKDKADDLVSQHVEFIEQCQKAGINLLSLGSDGAATELAAQEQLIDSATTYLTYINKELEVDVKVPLFGSELKPVLMIQDPKHARKTAANQPLSGARVISFGRFHVDIQQLAVLLEDTTSPLYKRDVFDSDRQDDGRAYRMFSAKTLKAALNREECTGLAIYLFVFGEMVDAWLNQTIGHQQRLCSSWTAEFFLRIWKNYLLKRQDEPNSLMSLSANGISPQSLKIFSTMASRLLGLIISHQKYYPDVPLMPWKHGTKPVEHVFGWMRVICPNFTVLDARQMVPKLHAVVKSVMSGLVKISKSKHIHAGYEFAFLDEQNSDHIDLLRYFPTNEEIEYDLTVAKKRAISLATFVGMTNVSIFDIPVVLSKTNNSGDISTCMADRYKVVYKDGLEDSLETAVAAAAETVDKQQRTDVLISKVPEVVDKEIFNNVAMSLSTILNQDKTKSSSEAHSQAALADLAGIDHKLDTFILNNQDGLNLQNQRLLQLRVAHESQVRKHRGNEQAKINVDNLRKSPGEPLKPSECSKLVAVVMKNAEATPTGILRIHRWNISVKLDLFKHIKNTSTHLDLPFQASITGGGISANNPIENGKFVVFVKNSRLFLGKTLAVYIYKNKKHAWVKSADSQEELSYVSVQVLVHEPHSPVATVAEIMTPDEFTFSRLPIEMNYEQEEDDLDPLGMQLYAWSDIADSSDKEPVNQDFVKDIFYPLFTQKCPPEATLGKQKTKTGLIIKGYKKPQFQPRSTQGKPAIESEQTKFSRKKKQEEALGKNNLIMSSWINQAKAPPPPSLTCSDTTPINLNNDNP